jgi:hypothetical protein
MKAVAKYGNEDSVDVLLLRFGLIDHNLVAEQLKKRKSELRSSHVNSCDHSHGKFNLDSKVVSDEEV